MQGKQYFRKGISEGKECNLLKHRGRYGHTKCKDSPLLGSFF